MAIEIKQQKKNNSGIFIILIIIALILVGYLFAKDFLRLEDFVKKPIVEEILPSKEAVQINTDTLDVNKIANNPLFRSLITHIKWPPLSTPVGKTNIFRP